MREQRRSPAARWLMSLLLMTSLFAGLLVNNAKAKFSRTDALNQRRESAPVKFEALSRYATDLTELARREQIALVKGHDLEIRHLLKVLAQTERNNPILIDDARANRSLVREGVAIKLPLGQPHLSLQGKRLWELNFNSLAANTKTAAEVESRLKSVLDEVAASRGQVILFIDELPSTVGASA